MESRFVFISHSSVNKSIADAICHMLEDNGIACWIAPRDILPGRTWAGNIMQAIQDCSAMVLVYSSDYTSSTQVANDVNNACSLNKTIIPFMVDDTPMNDDFNYYLSRRHWLVAYPDYEEKLQPLVEAVAKVIGHDLSVKKSVNPSVQVQVAKSEDNPRYENNLRQAREALKNYEIDTAFAELLSPALDDYKDARFLMASIVMYRARLFKIDRMRFTRIKTMADTGNSFACYLMARYYYIIELNDDEWYDYSQRSASAGDSYGLCELAKYWDLGKNADTSKYLPTIEEAINKGNPWAEFELAKNYLYGWTVTRNFSRANSLLRSCMEKGIPESFATVAYCYSSGNGGFGLSREKEIEYYEKAINLGYLEAYSDLAITYLWDNAGMNYSSDEQLKAIPILRKGVDMGIVGCISTLAYCYSQGYGVPQKEEQAYRWYKKAAQEGDRRSYFNLGHMDYYGIGRDCDEPLAWEWFKKGAEHGDSGCNYMLGIMCQDGYAQDGKSSEDCLPYFERSSFLGGSLGVESALKLYDIYRTRDLERHDLFKDLDDTFRNYDWAEKDNVKAMRHLKRAVVLADGTALPYFKYGMLLCDEKSEFCDELEGIKYLKMASDYGDSRAAVRLGELYAEGNLVDKDLTEARKYFQSAIDKDYAGGYLGMGVLQAKMLEIDDSGATELGTFEEEERVAGEAVSNLKTAIEKGCKLWNDDLLAVINDLNKYTDDDDIKILVGHLEQFAKGGNRQAMIDMGVYYDVLKSDADSAIHWYEYAARFGSQPAAYNLGDIYYGKRKDDGIDVVENLPAAYYWYTRDHRRGDAVKFRNELSEIGRKFARDYEKMQPSSGFDEYLRWVFPERNDKIFSAKSSIDVFKWAEFGSLAQEDWPEDLKALATAYNAFRERSVKYPILDLYLPNLSNEDFFPCMSVNNIMRLQKAICKFWLYLKNKSGHPVISKHQDRFAVTSMMDVANEKFLDFLESETDEVFVSIVLDVIELMMALETITSDYVKLLPLNDIDRNAEKTNAPDEYIKEVADMFFDGTKVIPANRTIAGMLYEKCLSAPGVYEKIRQCK